MADWRVHASRLDNILHDSVEQIENRLHERKLELVGGEQKLSLVRRSNLGDVTNLVTNLGELKTLAAVRAELTAQIDELRGTQLAMLSAFAHAWPQLKQHEPPTLPSLVPTLQLVLPCAVAADATEADARVGALLQENARLRREARIAAAERDSAVESLERLTQKYYDLKRMRNIKRVTFVGEA